MNNKIIQIEQQLQSKIDLVKSSQELKNIGELVITFESNGCEYQAYFNQKTEVLNSLLLIKKLEDN